ncbi:hypothetical protein HCN44_002287 [Aphidius gifuensis]|uniref:Muskelin N-terminal domain-containing protein n=1 Tax=Aphidius gifuensis TaxID=684658 RepID=A0A834Y0Z8_APHGI|nr:muskelin-like [Aphidius gifuensis]KAF7996641.1 hypothetical protein HCN44_002287 [Aphidius gifuensis]
MRKLHNMASFDNMSDDNNCNNNNNNNNCKILRYRIYKCSSYSPTYVPENILVDKPLDQSSRWSSENDNHPQYIVLKLDQASIVKSITFGKFEKTHVCNMKKFKIYGAIEYDKWTELLNAGLKNDTVPETFELKHTIGCDNVYYPIRYVKIMPLESWGPSFNYSIWFVCLNGIDDKSYIDYNINRVNQYLNNEIIRLCMKHFRRLKQTDIVDSLVKNTSSSSSSSTLSFEDKHLSLLYDILVNNGDYKQAEIFITNSINNGLLDEYISNQPYKAIWNKINCDEPKPGKRGGHQMVLDSNNEILYLFGGWDGRQDLADLWSYDIKLNKWTLICNNTELVGGPNARSCHKMAFDQDRKQLFTIGKYLDTQYRNVDNLKCDFYVYDIEKNQWTLISNDTYSVGGPPLIFDHQMCIDHDKRMIYVFGGRILLSSLSTTTNTNTSSSPPPQSVNAAAAASCNVPSPSSSSSTTSSTTTTTEPLFSGLYSYHIPTSTWKLLASDTTNTNSSSNINCSLRARVGHSMLFNQIDRKLYISPGQRCKEYLNDYFTYNVDTNDIQRIYLADFSINNSNNNNNNNNNSLNKNERFSKDEFNKNISPGAGFTQRATIDPVLGEIYVLSGPGKDKDKRDENVQNSFWVYNIKNSNWTCIYRNENTGEKYWSKMQDIEPCPRFAHQLVYDKYKKIHYLFGGNPGRSSLPKLRLDDFWTLKLCRPTHDELLKNFKWIIRKYKFKEIAINGNSIEALEYLQNDVYEIIDHNDPIQTKEFQLLTSVLFKSSSSNSRTSTDDAAADVDVDQVHNKRVQLYDKISEFFPESMTQPRANLTDLLL